MTTQNTKKVIAQGLQEHGFGRQDQRVKEPLLLVVFFGIITKKGRFYEKFKKISYFFLKKLMKQQVSASILSADFSRLGEEIKALHKAGADRLHIDVMDGHFVPNLTIGAPVLKSLKPISPLPLDIHLMVQQPEKLTPSFVKAGASSITFHIEATQNPKALLKQIKKEKVLAGLSLKPATPLESLFPFLPYLDLVLIMTVEPGFGGQALLPKQVNKILALKQEIKQQKLKNIMIHVDGGVNDKTKPLLALADVLVSGHFIFSHKSYKQAIACLKHSPN